MERISRDLRYLFSFGQKLSWMAEMMRSIWKNWVAKPTIKKRVKKLMRNTLKRGKGSGIKRYKSSSEDEKGPGAWAAL